MTLPYLLKRLLFISIYCNVSYVFAAAPHHDFHTLFSSWTNAFNHQQLAPTCALFAKDLSATYQGAPKKTFTIVCDGFKKIFSQQQRRYHYRFKILRIEQNENFAAVRITWYLTVYEYGKIITQIQDEGLDVLRKEKDGTWKIIQYLAYPAVPLPTLPPSSS